MAATSCMTSEPTRSVTVTVDTPAKTVTHTNLQYNTATALTILLSSEYQYGSVITIEVTNTWNGYKAPDFSVVVWSKITGISIKDANQKTNMV